MSETANCEKAAKLTLTGLSASEQFLCSMHESTSLFLQREAEHNAELNVLKRKLEEKDSEIERLKRLCLCMTRSSAAACSVPVAISVSSPSAWAVKDEDSGITSQSSQKPLYTSGEDNSSASTAPRAHKTDTEVSDSE